MPSSSHKQGKKRTGVGSIPSFHFESSPSVQHSDIQVVIPSPGQRLESSPSIQHSGIEVVIPSPRIEPSPLRSMEPLPSLPVSPRRRLLPNFGDRHAQPSRLLQSQGSELGSSLSRQSRLIPSVELIPSSPPVQARKRPLSPNAERRPSQRSFFSRSQRSEIGSVEPLSSFRVTPLSAVVAVDQRTQQEVEDQFSSSSLVFSSDESSDMESEEGQNEVNRIDIFDPAFGCANQPRHEPMDRMFSSRYCSFWSSLIKS
jgi:hypothetical protein